MTPKRLFLVTLVRVDNDKPFDRKHVEVEARMENLDKVVKRTEREASTGREEWRHIRVERF